MATYLAPGVYVEEVPAATRPLSGVGTAVAGFVGFAPQGPVNEPVLVTNWLQYVAAFGEFDARFAMAKSVYGYFSNGGGRAYIIRVPYPAQGSGETPEPPSVELYTQGDNALPAFKIKALNAATPEVQVEVVPPEGENNDNGAFRLIVKQGDDVVESYEATPGAKGRSSLASQVNTRSRLIRVETLDVPAEALGAGLQLSQLVLHAQAPNQVAMIEAAELVGDTSNRSGFSAFETLEEITMVMAPDLVAAQQGGLIDLEGVKTVQLALIAHCELMGNRMAILDPPIGMNAQQIAEWRRDVAGYDSKFAVMYWPWISVFDPALGHNTFQPPSGHVAGIWSRNDDTRGVFKAPANEVVRGAVATETAISRGELDLLNPMGVNSIKAFPGRGIRVWGARTLASDAEWRYVNVRRYFNYLEESILQGTQWCVFEPNDERLWGRIRRTIAAFLVNEWRSGALFGSTPGEAFFIKCDGENNTAETIDAGMVVVEIGVAPVKPAEFVIFRLAQFSGGTSISE